MTTHERPPYLSTTSLGKRVPSPEGELVILDDISLSIAPGESLAIVGASGSGKSTLLGLMAGLDTASHGNVVLDGHDLGSLDEDGRASLRASRVANLAWPPAWPRRRNRRAPRDLRAPAALQTAP